MAFGKIGELIYEKNFLNGELDGNFLFSMQTSESDVYRYREAIRQGEEFPSIKDTFASKHSSKMESHLDHTKLTIIQGV